MPGETKLHVYFVIQGKLIALFLGNHYDQQQPVLWYVLKAELTSSCKSLFENWTHAFNRGLTWRRNRCEEICRSFDVGLLGTTTLREGRWHVDYIWRMAYVGYAQRPTRQRTALTSSYQLSTLKHSHAAYQHGFFVLRVLFIQNRRPFNPDFRRQCREQVSGRQVQLQAYV